MKGIVLSSQDAKSIVLSDEGLVLSIKGNFEVGKRINIKSANKNGSLLKTISIILATIAVLMVISVISLYVIGKNFGDSDDSVIASSESSSNEDENSEQDDENVDASSETTIDNSEESSSLEESDSATDASTTDIPQAPEMDENAPSDIPSDNGQQGPGNGQMPDGQAPDGQAPNGQPGDIPQAPSSDT